MHSRKLRLRHGRRGVLALLALVATIALSSTAFSQASATEPRVSAYWADWEYYYDAGFTHDRVDFSRLTHVQYAFAWNDADGVIYFTDQNVFAGLGVSSFSGGPGGGPVKCSPPFWHPFSDFDNTRHAPICQGWNDHESGFAKSVHDAGAKALLSIGGWTLSHQVSQMLETPASRQTFVDHSIQFLIDWDFDGIDLDFEFPGYAPHAGRPIDKANFTLLLQELREALAELGAATGREYELTAAVSCGPQIATNAYDFGAVARLLDYVNLLSYDFGGDFDPVAQHNSPLYPYAAQIHEGFDTDSCREFWMTTGQTPASKLVLGMAHYGRSVAGAKALGEAASGHDFAHWSGDTETRYYQIFDKMQTDPTFHTFFDSEAGTHFGYFDAGGAISFEDARSLRLRAEYVVAHDLAGVMIWQLHGGMIQVGGAYEYPLLDAALQGLSGLPPPSPTPVATPESTPTPTPSPSASPAPTAVPDEPCSAFAQPYAGDPGYAVGDIVTFGGQAYASLHAPNFWSPSAAPHLWRATTCAPGPSTTPTPTPGSDDDGECAPYVQPYAGDTGYAIGQRVLFKGQGYESLHEPNWWSPAFAPQLWQAVSCDSAE